MRVIRFTSRRFGCERRGRHAARGVATRRVAVAVAALLVAGLGGASPALAQGAKPADKKPADAKPADAEPADAEPADAAAEGGDPLLQKTLLQVPPAGKEYSVEELVRTIGMTLGKVVVIDEAIKGKKIKIYTSAELNFYTLVEVFRTYGIELEIREAGGTTLLRALLVRSLQQVAGAGLTKVLEPGDPLPSGQQIVTAIYYFKFLDQTGITQLQTAIRALMTRDPRHVGNIVLVPGTNAIIITDFASSADYYLRLCRAVDRPTPQLDYKIVQVNYALADDLAALVNQLTPALQLAGGGAAAKGGAAGRRRAQPVRRVTGNARAGGAAPGQPQVVADSRTNKLVILAVPDDIARIERLIRELDVKVEPPPRHFHVYKCENASAVDLADALNALFGASVPFGRGSSSQSRRSSGSRFSNRGSTGSNRNVRQGAFGNQRSLTSARTPTTRGRSRTGAGGVLGATNNPGAGEVVTRIVPDEQTNSLLIQAAPEDYRDILVVLEQLDKKRRRVQIECQIWEIEVTDDLFFGVEQAVTDGADSGVSQPNSIRAHGLSSFGLLAPVVSEDGGTLGLTPSSETFGRGGLIFALTQGSFDRVPLIVQALATESKANLLTMPFATTNDGETAIFRVSQQEPFQTNTANNVASFSGFDFATAESSLEVTPRIASGSNLTLELALNIESFTAASSGGAPPPSSSRSYEGTVTIPNREYIVFGGLELASETEARARIPILGDIPFIGWLFGTTSTRKVRRRIYVFVRPVIFDDTPGHPDFDGDVKASRYALETVKAGSLFGDMVQPIIPDDVIDAPAPGIKATLYGLYGEGGERAFPDKRAK